MFEQIIAGVLWVKNRWPSCDSPDFDSRLVGYHGCLSNFHPLVDHCPPEFDGKRYGRMLVSVANKAGFSAVSAACGQLIISGSS